MSEESSNEETVVLYYYVWRRRRIAKSISQDYYLFSTGRGVRIRTWPQVFVVFADQLSSSVAVAVGLTLVNIKCGKFIEAARSYRQIEGILGSASSHNFRLPLAVYLIFLSVFLPSNVYEYTSEEQLVYLPTYLVYLPLVALHVLYTSTFLDIESRLRHLNKCLPALIKRPQSYHRFRNHAGGIRLAGYLIWKIVMVKKQFEKLFGLPLLLLMAHNVLHNTITPYYVLVNLLHPELSRYNLVTWIMQAIWLAVHAINLLLMVWPTQMLLKQVS
ncbi:hypothetical protein O3M35_004879 [Rhynocoris fuscipes]|uniref:Uncharacterized protein n=1 Tax=Rhynocoris fuscipes TaxID=488301 RepID=A0AAW1DHW2_9HEMI